jgi:hypothetical protein
MDAVTVFGVFGVSFMMLMYALERCGAGFVARIRGRCALSSAYGLLAGAWPFGIREVIRAVVALRRYSDRVRFNREPHPARTDP